MCKKRRSLAGWAERLRRRVNTSDLSQVQLNCLSGAFSRGFDYLCRRGRFFRHGGCRNGSWWGSIRRSRLCGIRRRRCWRRPGRRAGGSTIPSIPSFAPLTASSTFAASSVAPAPAALAAFTLLARSDLYRHTARLRLFGGDGSLFGLLLLCELMALED
jgi:hypothetical protein